jgi:hypothetical protein
MLVAFAKVCLKVLLGIDDDGSPVGAEGAKVVLSQHTGEHLEYNYDQESGHAFDGTGHSEVIPASGTTDVNGRVCFDEDDRLPALTDYMLTVYPYDMNPDDEDGVEFGLFWEWIDLTPYDPFNMDHASYYSLLPEYIVDLRRVSNPSLGIAFSQPALTSGASTYTDDDGNSVYGYQGSAIGPNQPIRLYWTVPVDPSQVRL